MLDSYFTEALEMKNYENKYFQLEMLKYLLLSPPQIDAFEKIPIIPGCKVIQEIKESKLNRKLSNQYMYDFECNGGKLLSISNVDKKIHGIYLDQ